MINQRYLIQGALNEPDKLPYYRYVTKNDGLTIYQHLSLNYADESEAIKAVKQLETLHPHMIFKIQKEYC